MANVGVIWKSVMSKEEGVSRVAKVAQVETQDGFEDQNPATRSLVSTVKEEFDAMSSNIARDVAKLLKELK